MNHTELAWAAGFFDGEGSCVCRFVKGQPFLSLHISQADERPLERFAEAVGFPFLRIYYSERHSRINKNWLPQYSLQINRFEQVVAITAKLWIYLCEPKQEQIHDTFIDWQKHKGVTRNTRNKR